jgi:hypothetical protein
MNDDRRRKLALLDGARVGAQLHSGTHLILAARTRSYEASAQEHDATPKSCASHNVFDYTHTRAKIKRKPPLTGWHGWRESTSVSKRTGTTLARSAT